MKPVLLKNAAKIVTMVPTAPDNPLGVIDDQDVLIDEKGRIATIGRRIKSVGADIVDVKGRFIIPGFVNAHDHLWQRMIAGVGCDQDLIEWLPVMRGIAQRMNRQASRAGVALGASRMLNMGVTSVLDWSHAPTAEFLQGNVEALKESGIRWTLAYAGPDFKSLGERASRRLEGESYQIAGHPALAPEASVSDKSKAAAKAGVSFNVHWLENENQRVEQHTESLAQLTPPGSRLILNHAVHATQSDLDALAPRSLYVAHCPSSNMRLASGTIDLDLFRRNAVVVGLGLDGGTNDCGDMFDTMRAAIGLQRVRARDANVAPGTADALRMATLEGARVLGTEAHVGSLEIGKLADIVVLNPRILNTAYLAPVIDSIVYAMTAANVEHVLVGGKFKKRDFALMDVDLDKQSQSLERATKRLKTASLDDTTHKGAAAALNSRRTRSW